MLPKSTHLGLILALFIHMIRRSLLICLLVVSKWVAAAPPDSLPRGEFISPVNFPIYLAGNFGELRPNHFHAGLDIKTQGKEGATVRCVSDGFVSRIKVSLKGYGKVVYVDHPNGYTSVYAHMQRFNESIERYLRKKQYEEQSFTIEVFPDSGDLSLKQGETVGLSGNTGGSGGPHLHFEIRDTQTEEPINPLLLDFPIVDNIAPTLRRIAIYPLNDQSSVDGKNEIVYLNLRKEGKSYHLERSSIPVVKGKIGFGIECLDHLNQTSNRNGIYSIELRKDNVPVFVHHMDRFSFDESHCINSHVDYHHWKKRKRRVQRCFAQSGNNLSTYKSTVNNGQLFFLDDTLHRITCEVKDSYGNPAIVSFTVQSDQNIASIPTPRGTILRRDTINVITTKGMRLTIDTMGLYEDDYYSVMVKKAVGRAQSPMYFFDRHYFALAKKAQIDIDIPNPNEKYLDRYFLAELDSKTQFKKGYPGKVENSVFTAEIKSIGNYTLMIDSVKPTISPISFPAGGMANKKSRFVFRISDKLNYVTRYDVYVDDIWVLAEYDRKSGRLVLHTNEIEPKETKRSFRIIAEDALGNQRTYESFFRY